MRIKQALLALLLTLAAATACAQDFTSLDTLKFYDALRFRMINKGWDNTFTPYTRIPATLKDSVRETLWDRAKNSAGIGIRFATNSHCVAVRYNLMSNFHMAHMADTGIKGTDLYILDEKGVWRFVNCNRPYRDYNYKGEGPRKDSIQSKVYIDKLDGQWHEYMIYLPLYDGINWMEIGVEPNAEITQPKVNSPRKEKKFVFYGTSILHGGCASRTGMVATSILQRDLDVECVNIGVSGEGKMDSCMARAMAAIPHVDAYILDPIPNCTKLMCDTVTYGFVKILRDLRPEVPIFMVEGQEYSYERFSGFYSKYLPEKNYEFHKNYLKLKAENPRNLYYIDRENLYGPDCEGSVDGIHLTDLGFYYYAQKLKPYLEAILNGTPVPFQDKVNRPK